MSVINQMLVDLERRRASGAERNRIPNHVRALPGVPASTRSAMPVVLVSVFVLVVLFAALWWSNRQRVTPVHPAPAIKNANVPPPTAMADEQDAVEQVARRMSFELTRVPDAMNPQAVAPVTSASVVGREAPTPARSMEATVAETPRPVPRAAPGASTIAAVKPAAEARPEISKQIREPTPQQRADAEYARGVSALHQGKSTDARSAFESALQIVPTHHAARQALVGVLLDARQLAEASRVLQDGLQLAPAQFGFAMALARLQVEQGDLDAGALTLSRSIEYAGGNAEYAAFYAGLLQRQQRHAEAVEMFGRALRARGNSGLWLLGMGLSLDALGRADEAQEAYRRAKAAGNLPGDLAAFADQRLR